MKLSNELAWRGFAYQTTLSDTAALDREKYIFYWGVDPSADSLTIGNLAIAMMVRHFIEAGHKAVILIGGATGLIGDPDGKTSERDLQSAEEVEANKQTIASQCKQLFIDLEFEIVDNIDWFKEIKYIDFLRDFGKHVAMRQMLSREFVQNRLGENAAGISYAEFSYSLIQGYDFLHLNQTKGVNLQICGADQWGNSIAGVELIRRVAKKEAHVWSAPLVVNKATGEKFGKTEAGAIWLNPEKTSVYQFYQFWLNVDDESVEDYLKIYTILNQQQIHALMVKFNHDRGGRLAQKTLADQVTGIVHGLNKAAAVKRASEVLFGEINFKQLVQEEVEILKAELPTVKVKDDLAAVIVEAGLAGSKTEARNFINSGAISVNGQKAGPKTQDLFNSGPNLLKRGKNSFAIIEK
ncbi:tyrosine--tRNA ligase [Candidatus Parcubacteria bacterium]|nr:tyrosine--tRNA ligase [Candidatus Parcubacteria bacterium]